MDKFLEKLEIYAAVITGIITTIVILLQPNFAQPIMLIRLIALIVLAYCCGLALRIYFVKKVVPPKEEEEKKEENEDDKESTQEGEENAEEKKENGKAKNGSDDPLDQLLDPDDTNT